MVLTEEEREQIREALVKANFEVGEMDKKLQVSDGIAGESEAWDNIGGQSDRGGTGAGGGHFKEGAAWLVTN